MSPALCEKDGKLTNPTPTLPPDTNLKIQRLLATFRHQTTMSTTIYETPSSRRSSPVTSPPSTPSPKRWEVSNFEISEAILIPLLSKLDKNDAARRPTLQPRKDNKRRRLIPSEDADSTRLCSPAQQRDCYRMKTVSPKSVLNFAVIEDGF